MGDPKGFLSFQRADPRRLPVLERVGSWKEFYTPASDDTTREQAARCMDCGVPFCQGDTGCPVQNIIPDWNDLVYHDRWQEALATLHSTNNFPEFTGRLCPAPCESACVLGIIERPVAIRSIEQAIADRGFDEGWVVPRPPAEESGYRVAIVGSGPAGLAAAQELRRRGHAVVVYEKSDRVGGLLRYGIPDFKMEKRVLDRRVAQLAAEGVRFETGVDVGRDVSAATLRRDFDAIVLALGAARARELGVPGRALAGVHLAMDFLEQQNRRGAGDEISARSAISAAGKRVIVIGGGDTGSDCIGTCHRQGALEVVQLEVMPQPPASRHASTPWPLWPMQLRTSHAHEEGGMRDWSVATTELSGAGGRVERLHAVRVAPALDDAGRMRFEPVPDSAFTIDAELVLLAMGFEGPSRDGLHATLGVTLDARGCIVTDAHHLSSLDGVFAAGDVRRGASLIVWAIREGRDAARAVDAYVRRHDMTAASPTSLPRRRT
ncbi:MAG: glutamate synthase subunit beta [Gemmatimonadaceae bacterium]|nr:glutamate synthase subunit beta [Gemmatimonadaceae bacterium]